VIRNNCSVDEIINKALNEEPLSKQEIIRLLRLDDPLAIDNLLSSARALRYRYFGNKIFLYGFLYFSTWCHNDCAFCYYRSSNELCERYRKTNKEVLEAACQIADSGIHLLDLTMGEDPFYSKDAFTPLLQLTKEVRRQTGLTLMISPGILPDNVISRLSDAGVEWYACYQETHNRNLFARLRLGQDYTERLSRKYQAKDAGIFVEEGILLGVGETVYDIADSIEAMRKMGAQQIRVMGFVPQKGTPMQGNGYPKETSEQMVIAVLRLVFPNRLIPASLDVHGIAGLQEQLEAGANVVTSLITPQSGMLGVAQSTLDVAQGLRTKKGILPILNNLMLEVATVDEYVSWMVRERNHSLKQRDTK
jgi:methylornithine synthase